MPINLLANLERKMPIIEITLWPLSIVAYLISPTIFAIVLLALALLYLLTSWVGPRELSASYYFKRISRLCYAAIAIGFMFYYLEVDGSTDILVYASIVLMVMTILKLLAMRKENEKVDQINLYRAIIFLLITISHGFSESYLSGFFG